MNWNYRDNLNEELLRLNTELGLGLDIEVAWEEDFLKHKSLNANQVYVVVKRLSSTLEFNIKSTPIQINVLSEENGSNLVFTLFNEYSNRNNWKVQKYGNIAVKMEYGTPITMSNFEEIGKGFRSVLFMSGTLIEMENIIDFGKMTIDEVEYDLISSSIDYVMTTNTQQLHGGHLSKSEKQTSCLALTIVITPQDSDIILKALKTANGTLTGNESYKCVFSIGGVNFDDNFKLINFKLDSNIADIPSVALGFMR